MNDLPMKKKKGSNYTEDEKQALITIVTGGDHHPEGASQRAERDEMQEGTSFSRATGYIDILENKFTNGEFLKKKQDTWIRVANEFNAIATSGPRSWVQLRHAYANLKQRTKKSVANEHKQLYNLKSIKLKAADDKKNIMKTGGGGYRSVLSEMDKQVLALAAPQIIPLRNPYDDASAYFDDESPNFAAVYCDGEITTVEGNTNLINMENLENTPPDENVNDIPAGNIVEESTLHEIEAGETEHHDQTKQKVQTRRKGKKATPKTTKEKYFEMKLRNALLERKLLFKKYRREILEIELLKYKIKKLRK